MRVHCLMLIEPPSLSDRSVIEIADFLHEFTTAFANHYRTQLLQYHSSFEDPFGGNAPDPRNEHLREPDLFDGTEHEPPPF